MPLLTQSDLGSENFGVANTQTSMRQAMDPSLRGTLQHLWMHGHTNVKPEIAWRQFRHLVAEGLEKLSAIRYTYGQRHKGWYPILQVYDDSLLITTR